MSRSEGLTRFNQCWSSILGRGALIDLQVGIGLTTFAPKYTVILSGTYRFATGL